MPDSGQSLHLISSLLSRSRLYNVTSYVTLFKIGILYSTIEEYNFHYRREMVLVL